MSMGSGGAVSISLSLLCSLFLPIPCLSSLFPVSTYLCLFPLSLRQVSLLCLIVCCLFPVPSPWIYSLSPSFWFVCFFSLSLYVFVSSLFTFSTYLSVSSHFLFCSFSLCLFFMSLFLCLSLCTPFPPCWSVSFRCLSVSSRFLFFLSVSSNFLFCSFSLLLFFVSLFFCLSQGKGVFLRYFAQVFATLQPGPLPGVITGWSSR